MSNSCFRCRMLLAQKWLQNIVVLKEAEINYFIWLGRNEEWGRGRWLHFPHTYILKTKNSRCNQLLKKSPISITFCHYSGIWRSLHRVEETIRIGSARWPFVLSRVFLSQHDQPVEVYSERVFFHNRDFVTSLKYTAECWSWHEREHFHWLIYVFLVALIIKRSRADALRMLHRFENLLRHFISWIEKCVLRTEKVAYLSLFIQ